DSRHRRLGAAAEHGPRQVDVHRLGARQSAHRGCQKAKIVLGAWCFVLGSRLEHQAPRTKHQEPGTKNQAPRTCYDPSVFQPSEEKICSLCNGTGWKPAETSNENGRVTRCECWRTAQL